MNASRHQRRISIKIYSLARSAIAAMLLAGATVAFAADKPSDPQIAHIAYTAGILDVEAAKQALSVSKNDAIRAFASNMITDHTAVNDQALALVKKLGVTPEDNPTSKGLVAQAEAKRAELAKLSGAEFDKAYANNEVAYHKAVNGALADLLIPSASNAELKGLLETGLKIFQGHEKHAEDMAGSLK